jgi:hypothetical protein
MQDSHITDKLKLTGKHHTESGVVLGLLLMLAGFLAEQPLYFKLAFASLILSLAVPLVFLPFSIVWFSLSQKLGRITSVLILSVVYLIILLPVAMIRKLAGKDHLALLQFKKGGKSVFADRNTLFRPEHIDKVY